MIRRNQIFVTLLLICHLQNAQAEKNSDSATAATSSSSTTIKTADCALKGITGAESGYWVEHKVTDNQSRLQYQLEKCNLSRITSKRANKCLSGRHIVLIGDSIVRLQYLSLIFFLQYGVYPNRNGSDTLGYPNVAREHAFTDWEAVYGE